MKTPARASIEAKKVTKRQAHSTAKSKPAQKVHIESPNKIKFTVTRNQPARHPALESLEKMRKLMKVVDKVHLTLERLIREIGSQTQDLRRHGTDLFYEGLAKNLKNKKKLKKEFENTSDSLLAKCGVKKKILTTEDVERIKSRVKLDTDQ